MPNSAAFNQKTAGQSNRRRVMQLLLRHRQLSRRQLAQLLKLKDATLSYLVAELIDKKLIRIAGKSGKHVMMELNPDCGWALGVELAQGWLCLNFIAANGHSLHRVMLPFNDHLDTLPLVLKKQIQKFSEAKLTNSSQLLGIGISICGIVDTQSGEVLLSNYYQVKNYPLKKVLETHFQTTVTIDNSTNCAAIGETLCNDRELKTFLHCDLLISRQKGNHQLWGYGLSLFINGQIYRGTHFAAGELITFSAPGSADSLFLNDSDIQALQHPTATLTQPLKELAHWLEVRLSPLVSFMDPSHIIIGGDYHCNNLQVMALIEEKINQKLYQLSNRHIQVMASNLGDYGLSNYAAYNVLNCYNENLFPFS